MAVIIEAITVVVQNTTLDANYPGGQEAFAGYRPNETYCRDEYLSRVAFMHPHDAKAFVAILAGRGLIPNFDGRAVDVAVVSKEHGFAFPCNWLALGTYQGIFVAWLAGTAPGDIIAPQNWNTDRKTEYLSAEQIKERLVYLRTEDKIDVYWDKTTGKELYVGRAGDSSRNT